MSPWLTTAEASDYLKVRPRTLLLWARQGKIPGHRLSGIRRTVWRFLECELDAVLTLKKPSESVTVCRSSADSADKGAV